MALLTQWDGLVQVSPISFFIYMYSVLDHLYVCTTMVVSEAHLTLGQVDETQSMLLHCYGGVALLKQAIACQLCDLMYEPDNVRNIARIACCITETPMVRLMLASIQFRVPAAEHSIHN